MPAASPGHADADRTTALKVHAGGFRCRTSRIGGCRSREPGVASASLYRVSGGSVTATSRMLPPPTVRAGRLRGSSSASAAVPLPCGLAVESPEPAPSAMTSQGTPDRNAPARRYPGCVADRSDPYRPTWCIRSPSGKQLTVEYDRLRNHWRVSPGEYVRLRLVDALAQATGSRPNADWILAVEREISGERPAP